MQVAAATGGIAARVPGALALLLRRQVAGARALSRQGRAVPGFCL